MADSEKPSSPLARRDFLRGVAAGASALAAAQTVTQTASAQVAATTGTIEVTGNEKPGSDFMVDVIKSLGIEYCAVNPGSSFRGLHESIVNYGGNKNPELLTCCHEEGSAAMAHGYAKIEGKPMMIMTHGNVGTQHASMAIYNAYADRAPMFVVIGNILDADYRRGNAEWMHSVQDAPALIRDYTKWDDTPVSLPHFAESSVRAYNIAMTPPYAPVTIVADGALQEEPIERKDLRIPKLSLTAPPQGESSAVRQAATMLLAAENPVIVTGRVARTPAAIDRLVELADLLQCRVQDQRLRMNFPSNHRLYGNPGANTAYPNLSDADLVLALEAQDLWTLLNSQTPINRFGMEDHPKVKPGTKIINISAIELSHKSNDQDFWRFVEADLNIGADAEATLPSLIEEVKRQMTSDRRRALDQRGQKIADANQKARENNRQLAAVAWDASPISTARLSAEIWAQVKNEDWSLVSTDRMVSSWPTRLWNFTKHYQFIGAQGAAGMGYGAPAAVGAALANRKYGRLSVAIQCDGDFNYSPAVIWTAAHHKIPILYVMHNNRAYHEERMYITLLGAKFNRGTGDESNIGTALIQPDINYSSIAKGYGLYAEGPITDPQDLAPALKRAIERVKAGEPALIDVHTQPR